MSTGEQFSISDFFPPTFMLPKKSMSTIDAAQKVTTLGNFPSGWSMSSTQGSLDTAENDTQTASQKTVGDFPIVLPKINELSPTHSFEKSWALLPIISNDEPLGSSGLGNISSSLNSSLRPRRNEYTILPPGGRNMGAVPQHIIPYTRSSSIEQQPSQHLVVSAGAIPGNYRVQRYLLSTSESKSMEMSRSSEGLIIGSDSPGLITKGSVRPPVEYYDNISSDSVKSVRTTTSSSLSRMHAKDPELVAPMVWPYRNVAVSDTSELLRGSGDDSSIASHQSTSHGMLKSRFIAWQSYRLSQPAGVGPDDVTPPVSISLDYASHRPPESEHGGMLADTQPKTPLRLDHDSFFAPVKISMQSTTAQSNANSWLDDHTEQLYEPPVAPLIAATPQQPETSDDGPLWRSLR